MREVTGQSEAVGTAIHGGTLATMRDTLLAMIGFFVLAIIGIAVLNRRLTRPIDVLMERTQAIAAGDFQAGPVIKGLGGEWGELARGFDAMV